jgi:hypothetical protein
VGGLMDSLMKFIMGSSTQLDIYVAIRLCIIFAVIEMIKHIAMAFAKGVK